MSAQECLDKAGEYIWNCDPSVSDHIQQSLSRLEVQCSLQKTAKLLLGHPRDKSLPNQQATRVKHFIKFVFKKTTWGDERHMRLRELDCNALKFCGLSYKVQEVLELSATQFDFLVVNIEDYIRLHKLSEYLYRDDVNKAVGGNFSPEDDVIFKRFLKSHVEHRPAKRKRDEVDSDDQRIVYTNVAVQRLSESQASRLMTAQHDVAQGTNSLLPEYSTAISSFTLCQQQQSSIMSITQSVPATPSFHVKGLRSGLENESQYDHVLIDQNYSNITGHYQVTDERPSKRPQLTPQLIFPEDNQYYCFSFMRRHMAENLPEPFRTGMKKSKLWLKEAKGGGLAITNGLAMYLPEAHTHDAYFVLRLSYNEGFKLSNLFGLGDPDT